VVADVEAVAALYAAEALFYSHPFRARQEPRDYVTWRSGIKRTPFAGSATR